MTRDEFKTLEVNQEILYRGRPAKIIAVIDSGNLRTVIVQRMFGLQFVTQITNESVVEFKSK